MAANRSFRIGPTAITGSASNMLNPGTCTGGTGAPTSNLYILVKHLHLLNTSSSAITVKLFIGATGGSAAGTEFIGSSITVPANSIFDYYAASPGLRLDNADFLTAIASTTGVTLHGEGEIGMSG